MSEPPWYSNIGSITKATMGLAPILLGAGAAKLFGNDSAAGRFSEGAAKTFVPTYLQRQEEQRKQKMEMEDRDIREADKIVSEWESLDIPAEGIGEGENKLPTFVVKKAQELSKKISEARDPNSPSQERFSPSEAAEIIRLHHHIGTHLKRAQNISEEAAKKRETEMGLKAQYEAKREAELSVMDPYSMSTLPPELMSGPGANPEFLAREKSKELMGRGIAHATVPEPRAEFDDTPMTGAIYAQAKAVLARVNASNQGDKQRNAQQVGLIFRYLGEISNLKKQLGELPKTFGTNPRGAAAEQMNKAIGQINAQITAYQEAMKGIAQQFYTPGSFDQYLQGGSADPTSPDSLFSGTEWAPK